MRSSDQQTCGPGVSRAIGRDAREFHSRVNCVWRSPLDREFNPDWGMYFIVGSHHMRCQEPGCDGVIRVDEREWAYCEKCHRIYNDVVADQEYENNRRKISMSRFIKTIKAIA